MRGNPFRTDPVLVRTHLAVEHSILLREVPIRNAGARLLRMMRGPRPP